MLRDVLRELRADLRRQRARTLLSLLGVGFGTLALVLLLAFSFGFEALFAERTRGLGDAVAIGWPQRTTLGFEGMPPGRPVIVRRDDVLALPAMVPALLAASAEFSTVERLRVGSALHRVPLSGVEPVFASLRNLQPTPGGRFPNDHDSEQRARVVFLGDALAKDLFGGADCVGRTVVLRSLPFLVVGVLQHKEQDSDYGGRDEFRAFVPATTFLAVFGDRGVDDFVFRARDAARQAECTSDVVRALANRLRFHPDDQGALSVWDTTEQQRLLDGIFAAFHVMLALGGGFALLVGGLSTSQLMLLSVRRRTTEIGLKLAVGATPRRVGAEWLLQAALLVLGASATGLLLAVLVIAAVRATPLVAAIGQPFVPLPIALAAAALVAGIALAAGALPARAAARLDPIDALRGGR